MKYKFVYTFLFLIFFCKPGNAQVINISEPVKMLALGDSYTIGESVTTSASWPVQFIDSLIQYGYVCEDPRIIARTGWRTDQLISAIKNTKLDENFNLVSLLIGVNNQYQKADFQKFKTDLDTLIKIGLQFTDNIRERFFILSIPDYSYTPFGQILNSSDISAEIDQYNQHLRKVARENEIVFIDITPISQEGLKEPQLVAYDGLHPSGEMYGLWVSEILKYCDIESNVNSFTKIIPEEGEVDIKLLILPNTLIITGDQNFLPVTYVIYNQLGVPVSREMIYKFPYNIELNGLESNIYFVGLYDENDFIKSARIYKKSQ